LKLLEGPVGLEPPDAIPDLKYWSDVAYLQWRLHASENSKLKYVLRYKVVNMKIEFVVQSIDKANGYDETASWPGREYHADSQEGRSLLGTPNGRSVACMLIQHEKHLGHKTVKKITVVLGGIKLMLLLHIVNVEVQDINTESGMQIDSVKDKQADSTV
jgi:hypothetical protein